MPKKLISMLYQSGLNGTEYNPSKLLNKKRICYKLICDLCNCWDGLQGTTGQTSKNKSLNHKAQAGPWWSCPPTQKPAANLSSPCCRRGSRPHHTALHTTIGSSKGNASHPAWISTEHHSNPSLPPIFLPDIAWSILGTQEHWMWKTWHLFSRLSWGNETFWTGITTIHERELVIEVDKSGLLKESWLLLCTNNNHDSIVGVDNRW